MDQRLCDRVAARVSDYPLHRLLLPQLAHDSAQSSCCFALSGQVPDNSGDLPPKGGLVVRLQLTCLL